jgi:hypothetical protein
MATPSVIAFGSTIRRKRISVISINGTDKTIATLRTQIKTLFSQIEMHVDNFYLDRSSGISRFTDNQQIQLNPFNTQYLDDAVAGLLPDSQKPQLIIKHCLAYMAISAIDFSLREIPRYPFPPTDMLTTHKMILAHTSESLLRQWRHDTMTFIGTDTIASTVNTSEAAANFTTAFSPWASTGYSGEGRITHPSRVLQEVVELGADLFGQLAEFRWIWQDRGDPSRAQDRIAVFPALSMITEPRGDGSAAHASNDGGNATEVVAPVVAGL